MIEVLFLAANPINTDRLRLDEEIRVISEKVRASEHRDLIRLISVWAVRPDDLLQFLNMHKPRIVHFSGHGNVKGEIFLVDDQGLSRPVSPRALKALFSTMRDNIQIVILNACYSHIQAQAIAEVVDCVIGMNAAIGDQSAIVFAASFYRAIGFGCSVKQAYEQGITALLLEGLSGDQIPQLLLKSGVDPSSLFLVEPALSLENDLRSSSSLKSQSSVPVWLPPLVVPFVNRTSEFKYIVNVLRNYGVAAILGLGGIGKTALASYVTHRLLEEKTFSDGIVWLDLRGIMRIEQVVRLIGQAFSLPLAEMEQPVDLVPYLSSKNALLVLDNADDISQTDMSRLLSARGRCAVLITSRQRNLVQQGAARQLLTPLPLLEAIELFKGRISHTCKLDKNILASICKRLGCLPLAIELAAAYLVSSDSTLDEYWGILSKKPLAGIQDIQVAFDLSYKSMTSKAQDILKCISLFEGEDFSIDAVSVGVNISVEETGTNVEILIEKSLLRKSVRAGRYTIHALLREYAGEKVTLEERNIYMKRLSNYYLSFSQEFGGANNFEGWNVLEIELRNILPVVNWCHSQGMVQKYVNFQESIAHCLQVRGYSTEVFESAERMLDLAKSYPNNQIILWQLTHRMSRMIYQGRYDMLMRIIEFVQPIFEDSGDIAGIAHIERNLGEMEEHKGNLQLAREYYEETLRYAYRLPDLSDEELPFNNRKSRVAWTSWKLGRIWHKLGDYSMSEKFLQEALNLHQERESPHGISAVLCEFGHLEKDRRNYEQAKNYYVQSINILQDIGYALYAAEAKMGLGQVEWILGNLIEASKLLRESLELFEQLGMPRESKEVRKTLNQIEAI